MIQYNSYLYPCLVATLVVLAAACGDDNSDASTTTSSSASSGTAGTGGGASSSSSGSGGDAGAGGAGGAPFNCETVRETALGPIDEVSTAAVTILSEENGVREIYVDASAGGFMAASMNPGVYLDLSSATRVDISDVAAFAAPNWDLALKRVVLRNNSAHSGGGDGAAAFLPGADFAAVSMADVAGATLDDETWFDMDCNYETDATGAIVTSLHPVWYEYDPNSNGVAPQDGVFIVRGGDGTSFFKLQILDYYANPDGTTGATSGRYVLRIATL